MAENHMMHNRNNPEVLISKLRVLPPTSFVEISWTDRTGEKHRAEGKIADYSHTSAVRRIETSNRTLLVVPAANGAELTLTELTETSRMHTLGTVEAIDILQHAIEVLILEPEGLDLPPYLWGYTGFLVVDTENKSKEIRVPEPGLKQYDDQLTTVVRELTQNGESRRIRIRLRAGPHRRYDVLQSQRVDEGGYTDTDIDTIGDYSTIEPLIHTVAALTEKIENDRELSEPIKHEAVHKLQSLQTPLLEARTLLCDPDPDATWTPDPDKAELDLSEYPAILERIQTKLKRLEKTVNSEGSIDGERLRIYSFNPPQRTVEDLLSLLSPPIPDIESYDGGVVHPSAGMY